MIVGNPIIMILKAILNWFRLRRDYIANSPRGKELLEKQLNNIETFKQSLVK